MNSKIAVYTAVIGAYDELPEHKAIYPDADYYCFVGKGEKRCDSFGPWKILETDYSCKTPQLISRYLKTHPHTLFPDYDYTLWIDANVGIAQKEFFSVLQQKMDVGVPISGIRHPETDCAYEEAVRVVHKGREKTARVLRMIRFLHRHRLPKHCGMFEASVLFRKGDDPSVKAFDESWWELISGIVCRDQLSLSYCMRKAGLDWDTLVPYPENVRSHPFFTYRQHRDAAPKRSFLYRKTRGLLVAVTKWYASF